MGHLALVNLLHVQVVGIHARTTIGDISQAVAQFHKGRIGSLANTFIIFLPCPLGACSSLVVGQRIGYLGGHQSLFLRHQGASLLQHIVISQSCILDAIVKIAPEEQRNQVLFLCQHQMAKVSDAVHHHIQVVAIGQFVAISLIHTLMQFVSHLPNMLYLLGIFRHQCLIFFSCHNLFIFLI